MAVIRLSGLVSQNTTEDSDVLGQILRGGDRARPGL